MCFLPPERFYSSSLLTRIKLRTVSTKSTLKHLLMIESTMTLPLAKTTTNSLPWYHEQIKRVIITAQHNATQPRLLTINDYTTPELRNARLTHLSTCRLTSWVDSRWNPEAGLDLYAEISRWRTTTPHIIPCIFLFYLTIVVNIASYIPRGSRWDCAYT